MHGMAFEFLGGRAHCGKPWHRFGAPYALVDCPDHEAGSGCAAVLENVLYGNPARCHDPVGWPTFKDWPHHNSLTHEQSYYRWLERAWRGGLRVYVNLIVENRVPLRALSAEAEQLRRDGERAASDRSRIHEMQDYIDAQAGGPGKGFFRIVDDPLEARKVINQGKLAVVQGMEVSEPFGCSWSRTASPTCDQARDRLLARPAPRPRRAPARDHQQVRQRAHRRRRRRRRDRARSPTAATSITTGSFCDLEECADPENHDHAPTAVDDPHNEDAIIANGLDAFLRAGRRCRSTRTGRSATQRALTPLGEYAIRGIMEREMIFDPDHMSVLGRDQALNLVESRGLLGDRLLAQLEHRRTRCRGSTALGGMVTPYAGDSESFVDAVAHLRDYYAAAGDQYFGVGYGADMNGFGSQGAPRGADVPNPVSYPFRVLRRQGHARPAALGRAGLRHQRRRRRPLRPLPRLDRGPADARRRQDRPRHGPRRRGLPADVGARRAGSASRAATAGASAS